MRIRNSDDEEYILTCGDILCSDVDLAAGRGVCGPVPALLPVHQLYLHPLQRGAHSTYRKIGDGREPRIRPAGDGNKFVPLSFVRH
jgi:hypothetical protein